MKERILKAISNEIKTLDDKDTEGHLWWNKFKEFIEALEDPNFPNDLKINFVEIKYDDKYNFDKKK